MGQIILPDHLYHYPTFRDAGFGLALWYRASDYTWGDLARTTPAVDGQVVKAWDDLSGNGYHIENEADDNDLARVAGGTNGTERSYINNRNSGTGQFRLSSADTSVLNWGSTQGRTVYARFAVENANQSNYILFKGGHVGGTAGWAFQQRVLSGNNVISFFLQDAAGNFIGVQSSPGIAGDTSYECWGVYLGNSLSSGITLRVNRADDSFLQNSSGTLGVTTNAEYLAVMGNSTSDADQLYLEELAVFSRALTTAEITGFEDGYLKERYG